MSNPKKPAAPTAAKPKRYTSHELTDGTFLIVEASDPRMTYDGIPQVQKVVAQVTHVVGTSGKNPYTAQRANHFVACLNAYEGIEDPAELRAQRDQLLRACKRILEHAEPCNCDEQDDCDHPIDADGNPMRLSASDYSALPQIIAAIARAEGRAK